MKKILLFLCLNMGAISLMAQQCLNEKEDFSTHLFIKNLEKKILDFESQNPVYQRTTLTIPIVVHVVWYDDEDNISDAQIVSQIKVLNQCFADARNPDLVPKGFKNLIGKADIQFCLATLDPKGKATNGIERSQTNLENIASTDAIYYGAKGGANAWNTAAYLNIWIATFADKNIGYGSRPGTRPTSEDGIVISPSYFGNVGTAANNTGHQLGTTAVHEVGHYFNLKHIWGDGLCESSDCTDSDMVDDTPNQSTCQRGCPEPSYSDCDGTAMGINYMDYINDDCMAMFTKGQVSRMRASIFVARSGLLYSNACQQAAVLQLSTLEKLVVKTAFIENKMTVFVANTSENETLWQLLNLQGQLIQNGLLKNNQDETLTINNLAKGIYLLGAKVDNTWVFRKVLYF